MIDLQTIMDEIAKLEGSQATFPVCQKLADLYIVKDHLMQKQDYNYERGQSNYARGRSNYGMYENNGGNNYAMRPDYYTEEMMGDRMRESRMSMPIMR